MINYETNTKNQHCNVTSIERENLAYLVTAVAEQTCVTRYLSANRSSSVSIIPSTLCNITLHHWSFYSHQPSLPPPSFSILSSSVPLTHCPPAPHLSSPFLYLIILPTCPPPTQPVTSEDEEEEELFTCPGTGTFPTIQDCNSLYVCSVPGKLKQLCCARGGIGIHFQVQKDAWKCPRGTLFSLDLGVCDFKRNVACGWTKTWAVYLWKYLNYSFFKMLQSMLISSYSVNLLLMSFPIEVILNVSSILEIVSGFNGVEHLLWHCKFYQLFHY